MRANYQAASARGCPASNCAFGAITDLVPEPARMAAPAPLGRRATRPPAPVFGGLAVGAFTAAAAAFTSAWLPSAALHLRRTSSAGREQLLALGLAVAFHAQGYLPLARAATSANDLAAMQAISSAWCVAACSSARIPWALHPDDHADAPDLSGRR